MFCKHNYKFEHVDSKDAKIAYRLYEKTFKLIGSLTINSWDAQFGFAIWSNRGTGIVPSKNLIKMVGVVGANTTKASFSHLLPVNEKYKILKHPDFIQNNYYYDNNYFKFARKEKTLIKKIFLAIYRLIKSQL